MSDLKPFNSERIYWAVEQVEREAGDIADLHLDDNTFYLKSEADKVIADMDCEIKKLKDLLDTLLKVKTEQIIHEVIQKTLIYGEGFIRVADAMKLITELRHHKYKRCLAMASICRLRARWFGDNAFYKKEQWALNWHRCWLELAEKFKPNNSTAQQGKG